MLLIVVLAVLVLTSVACGRRARRRAATSPVPATATPATTTPAAASQPTASASATAAATAAATASATPAATGPLLAPGDYTFRLTFDGRNREYLVHVPPQAAAGAPMPLVLNFHGGGSNADQQVTFSQMNPAADRDGYVVAYPDGTGPLSLHTWNAGGCCGYAVENRVDDVGFTRALLRNLEGRTRIDARRVYATGMSNGAMFAHRLGAEAADIIAAIAPVAGTTPLPTFAPSRAVPVMHIHSVDDPRALYAGGEGPAFPGTDYHSLHASVETTVASWAAFDGCPSTPTVEPTLHGRPGAPDATFTATKIVYAPCRDGVEVVLWKLTGSGHVWPGGQQDVPRILGAATEVIDANTEMWNFFKRFTLPR